MLLALHFKGWLRKKLVGRRRRGWHAGKGCQYQCFCFASVVLGLLGLLQLWQGAGAILDALVQVPVLSSDSFSTL